jgi:poly(3-hydroxybutyrate) depolymerase
VIYESFQAYSDFTQPARLLAQAATRAINGKAYAPGSDWLRKTAAACELIELAGLRHERPAFGIDSVKVGGQEVGVREEVVFARPFGSLLHFRKDLALKQPRVLLVAPLSGHFATLLRATVRTLLRDHDVTITDWHNLREVPTSEGRFGMDEYVLQLIEFMEIMGPGAHLVAVCQPTVGALAAVSLMAEDGNPATPASMTLMAGPIDTRINPSKVNELATGHSLEWFESNLIARVPHRYAGRARRVYPGFLQLAAFMSMNLERHARAFADLYRSRVEGDHAKAEATRSFYEEYFAVMDLPAEFYLDTVRTVFQEHALARGTLAVKGRRVDPGAVTRTMLLTVEGEKDDICSVGQTLAAHDLCEHLRPAMRMHHMQPGVGHYGVFSGKRWESGVYPLIRDWIHHAERRGGMRKLLKVAG